jgi:hypothetical protein
MIDFLLLATEGVEGLPGEHIASKLAVPLGIMFFCGSVFMLLWSNYGAKKGALIYAVAWSAFSVMLGVFWWFGAPGTPVATGLQNFPGQAGDQYIGKWFPFEPGSARATFYPATNSFENFVTVQEYIGAGGDTPEQLETNLKFGSVRGDVDGAGGKMLLLHLPVDASGGQIIGAERRRALQANTLPPGEGETRASPFYTSEVIELRVTDDSGIRVAAAKIATLPNYVTNDGRLRVGEPVEVLTWYAFKDPGALWFPSAVWTGLFLLMFVWSLWALDRMEQREKESEEQIEVAEDVAIPVFQ